MPGTKLPPTRQRYSIGEWYGDGLESLSPRERFDRAKREIARSALTGNACPFQENATCNKKGGVCSLRLYKQRDDDHVFGTGPIVTTCPLRFHEKGTIFRWVAETILETAHPIVLNEIGFLDRLKPNSPEGGDEGSKDLIGRIDNVIVHPSRRSIDWCALELQAVYFSGNAMTQEFAMLSKHESDRLPFPAAHRRPDWRSSGPKRLLPQLQTKVPTIRTWGKKMAIVIDEAFFDSMVGLEEERHLSNAEIVWFIVGYDPVPRGWSLVKRATVFTRLDSSVKALTGGVPLPKEQFEAELRRKLALQHPDHPLVRAEQ